jgi:small subunit ribosomal protein S20
MANIKSQIKRNSRSQRERFENRHYTSQIKTYFRRLETAVTSGDDEQITAEHRKLVSLIDKAVKRGALHANTGGRKKPRMGRSGVLWGLLDRRRLGGGRRGLSRQRLDSGCELLVGADHVHDGVDQRQVRERLREVAQVPAAARVDLLRVEVQR